MLNLDVNFKNMSVEELNEWLQNAYEEIGNAYEQENFRYANQIDMLVDLAKRYLPNNDPNALGESFASYVNKKIITEHTETGPSCNLLDIDENILFIKENIPDIDIDAEVTGLAQDGVLTELDPIVIDIAFDLPYIEDQQHITLTYNTADTVNVNLAGIPRSDYGTMKSGDDTIVSFKEITNLSDELVDTEFSETIEWPFEIKFKSAVASNKFAKAKTLAQKIVLLLGKEKLINKVDDYKSTHQKGSNQATRQAAREEAERQAIRRRVINTAGRTKSQILQEMLEGVDGVTNVTVSDIPGNNIYYKKFTFRVAASGNNYEILMARTLSPEEIADGKKAFVCRMITDNERGTQCDNRDAVITWVENLVSAANRRNANANLTPREREMMRLQAANRR